MQKSRGMPARARAERARKYLQKIFMNINHPNYCRMDIDFARRFGVTRHTIYKIRRKLCIPSRLSRIIMKLMHVGAYRYTIHELERILGVRYQALYHTIRSRGIKTRPDTPPIFALIKYQRNWRIRREASEHNRAK